MRGCYYVRMFDVRVMFGFVACVRLHGVVFCILCVCMYILKIGFCGMVCALLCVLFV